MRGKYEDGAETTKLERMGRNRLTQNRAAILIKYSMTPIVRTLVVRTANYPDRLGRSGNFVENSTKLTCLEITGCRIECSTVQCYGCLELQIRRGRKV
jgi:hypothetical protein